MRRLIVGTFEAVCIALVILPTALGILWVFFVETRRQDIGILATVGVFIFTSFLAGGALTLVEIAHNTKGCMDALRDMRLTRAAVGGTPDMITAERQEESQEAIEFAQRRVRILTVLGIIISIAVFVFIILSYMPQ